MKAGEYIWEYISSVWEYTILKTLETDLEICFVEHILDAMLKRAPVVLLSIVKIQCMIGCAFSFSMILKFKRLIYPVFSYIISSQLLLALQCYFYVQ